MPFLKKQEPIPKEPTVYDLTTPQLKEIIGTFEQEISEASQSNPQMIYSSVLGTISQGVEELARKHQVMTPDNRVRPFFYKEWNKKWEAMTELCCRREFAQRKEAEGQEALVQGKEELVGKMFMPPEDEIRPEDIPF